MGKNSEKRVTWIQNLPAERGEAWAYFSRSGKTIKIYAQANKGEIEPVAVKLTLRQMLSGNGFLNAKPKSKRSR